MNADERRSHRLNQLLKIYLRQRDEQALYQRAKNLGHQMQQLKII